jgi:dTDP-4-amino-4,6-dideoxygalactose transaminase
MIGEEEREAVADVLAGPTLSHGPRGHDFENAFAAFTGAPHAVATSSCAAALHLAYLGLGIGPGDEVIVPAQTHVATAHVVEACGAKPVFVDCDPVGNVDLDAAAAAVTERTRALSVVHYLGLPVDMTRAVELARKHDLFLVEDCALALGASWDGTHTGLLGDVGCFSFYPVKHITTTEGGMAISRREDVAERLSKQRAFGIDRTVVAERRNSSAYDVELLGLNYRMSEINAAIGIAQLKKLPAFLEARERNGRAIKAALEGHETIEVLDTTGGGRAHASFYALEAVIHGPLGKRRDELIDLLKANGLGVSIHYPRPVPLSSYYRGVYGYTDGQFPNAERISNESITLPVGPHVSEADAERVVEIVKATVEENS